MDVSASGFQRLYSPALSEMVDVFSENIPDALTLVKVEPDSKTLRISKTGTCIYSN